MSVLNSVYCLHVTIELFELFFVVFKLGFFLVKDLEGFKRALVPKPSELLETSKENFNLVFGSLDRTSQEKDDLDDFFVLGNPVIEWVSLIFWDISLVPVMDLLRGL